MACADVEGNYREGLLVDGNTDTVMIDPILRLTPPDRNGVFEGRFDGAGEANFTGQCSIHGPQTIIEFTRLHPGGRITTVYRGRVIAVPMRNIVIVRGGFTRVTVSDNVAAATVASGDWETEKPT